MIKEINASVHDIVDFVYAKGDILPAFATRNNMKDGMNVHLAIQKQHVDDEKEVFVKMSKDIDEFKVNLQGKIDLLEKKNDRYHIIEIKSTHTFENLTEETYLAHFAQAKFYGLMFYEMEKISKEDKLDISVLYVNKYSYKKKYYTKTYQYKELEAFFIESMKQYLVFVKIRNDWQEKKLVSINKLNFPYSKYRKGQLELMDKVHHALSCERDLFICAPTGIGKSLGTIYPAIQTLKVNNNQIFYLTAKTVIKDVARNAVNLLREHSDLKLKSLTITAKEKICINHECKCNPTDCIYAKDFYGKLNDAVLDIFTNHDDLYEETIISYAKKHVICPFEFQLTLSLYVDMIICDYNYVFDPRVYLRRFFDVENQNILFLIDEAHNMYDRVCNMYTQSIHFNLFQTIISHANQDKEVLASCSKLIDKLIHYQNVLRKERKFNQKYDDLDYVILDEIGVLLNKLERHFDKLREKEQDVDEELLNAYFEVYNFYKISEYYSTDFLVWVENKYDNLNYQISCLNPRDLINMRTELVKGSVFFSATLHPIDYYISLLGGNEETDHFVLESPFNQHHLQLYVNNHISTKYNRREYTKEQIAHLIEAVIKNGGKYLIYFPSYQYLEMVYDVFKDIHFGNFRIIKQERNMDEFSRLQFINQFDESSNNIVGFAVLGGVFAEGIDLKGDKLNGVVVVGVGLPTFDNFRNELRTYFDEQYNRGYQYAYMYPGFNKVLQAVGRVIRSENDYGIAVLIDERYLHHEYKKLFPSHWSHFQKI